MAYFANAVEAERFREAYCYRCRNFKGDTCPIWAAHEFHAGELFDETHVLHKLIPYSMDQDAGEQTCICFDWMALKTRDEALMDRPSALEECKDIFARLQSDEAATRKRLQITKRLFLRRFNKHIPQAREDPRNESGSPSLRQTLMDAWLDSRLAILDGWDEILRLEEVIESYKTDKTDQKGGSHVSRRIADR